MIARNLPHRFAIASLFGLISFLLDAPQIQAGEWQEFDPSVRLETIDETKIIDDHQPTIQQVMSVDAIAPTFTIANPEPGQRSLDTLKQYHLGQYNDDDPNFPEAEDWPEPINDRQIYSLFLVERLEYRAQDEEDLFNWELLSWIGGDYERLWIKSEGDVGLEHGDGEAEVQLLYGHLISSFWDFQAGLRYDRLFGSDNNRGRAFGAIGIQGLAPYLFEIDAAMFVSEDGDVSARFVSEYQLLLTQRLILQPELETNLAVQTVEEFGVGAGFNDIELGVRLRYEFSRQFAPYVGVNWSRKFGETADLAREEGESVDDVSAIAGFRLLF